MRPRTIGPKLLIIAATALAITIAGSAEAEHDHGGEGWDGGDRHEGRGWHGGEDRRLGSARQGRLARGLGLAWRRWLEWPCRLARQRPTSRLVQARMGRSRVARTLRLGLRLARARVYRPRCGLVGLAPLVGVERPWLGMAPRFMGLG
jgi:hypothetical protein